MLAQINLIATVSLLYFTNGERMKAPKRYLQ